MSILGYSASYFFPEYWSSTPLYGEKIIPLIDYILSSDFEKSDKLAGAFYMMENKYKNTGDLPIECIKEIIEESGYHYVLDLLGTDENSIRLLVYLLVLVHQLKGTGKGIEVVLNLLKRDVNPMTLGVVGSPTMNNGIVSDFSIDDYVQYDGFTVDSNPFELLIPIRTQQLVGEQAIAYVDNYGFYIGLNSQGHLILALGSDGSDSWDILDTVDGTSTGVLTPNTNYYLKLVFDGYNYSLKVSTDNKKFTDYVSVDSTAPLNLHAARIYLGIKNVGGLVSSPFRGSIDLTPFSTNIQNIQITEWFEEVPVQEENTFSVKVDLDLGVVSSDFFQKFSTFVKKYVYPTLRAFDAALKLQSNITVLPWVRHRVKYVASADVQEQSENWMKQKTPIDPMFSASSLNPLQNKIISEEIGDLDSLS